MLQRSFFTPVHLCFGLLLIFSWLPPQEAAGAETGPQVSVMHHFADDLGQAAIEKIFIRFREQKGIPVADRPVSHEDFKNTILQHAAEGRMPDVFSYWAGARTQFLVDGAAVAPLADLWMRRDYQQLIPDALADATRYNGQRYLVPFGYHAVGFFYNPKVFEQAGVTALPQTWNDFLKLCETLKAAGIKPLALGAKNRWPAQFWFDYLLVRTAGPDFRQRLMTGAVSYRAPQLVTAMQLWAELLQQGYFNRGILSDDWTDAADLVAAGRVGMTLMGSWVTGYWKNAALEPGRDFDFFPFPQIDPRQPRTVVGPIDGLLLGANSQNQQQAELLIDYLFSDLQVQAEWTRAQGALSPNRMLPASSYGPVMKKVLQEVEQADNFVFNYDLSTSPPVAELGLSMFSRFLLQPDRYADELAEMAEMAEPLLGPIHPGRADD